MSSTTFNTRLSVKLAYYFSKRHPDYLFENFILEGCKFYCKTNDEYIEFTFFSLYISYSHSRGFSKLYRKMHGYST